MKNYFNLSVQDYFKEFIKCHDGMVNRLLHIIGFIIIYFGIIKINIWWFIVGTIIQEIGHVYQYLKTKKIIYHPLYCFKPQLIFAFPIYIAFMIYILLS